MLQAFCARKGIGEVPGSRKYQRLHPHRHGALDGGGDRAGRGRAGALIWREIDTNVAYITRRYM